MSLDVAFLQSVDHDRHLLAVVDGDDDTTHDVWATGDRPFEWFGRGHYRMKLDLEDGAPDEWAGRSIIVEVHGNDRAGLPAVVSAEWAHDYGTKFDVEVIREDHQAETYLVHIIVNGRRHSAWTSWSRVPGGLHRVRLRIVQAERWGCQADDWVGREIAAVVSGVDDRGLPVLLGARWRQRPWYHGRGLIGVNVALSRGALVHVGRIVNIGIQDGYWHVYMSPCYVIDTVDRAVTVLASSSADSAAAIYINTNVAGVIQIDNEFMATYHRHLDYAPREFLVWLDMALESR